MFHLLEVFISAINLFKCLLLQKHFQRNENRDHQGEETKAFFFFFWLQKWGQSHHCHPEDTLRLAPDPAFCVSLTCRLRHSRHVLCLPTLLLGRAPPRVQNFSTELHFLLFQMMAIASDPQVVMAIKATWRAKSYQEGSMSGSEFKSKWNRRMSVFT